MNNDMMRRMMMRDSARRGRGYDRRSMDSRGGDYMRDERNQGDYHMPMPTPQIYSNQYAIGGRAYDGTSRNKYTPRGFDSRESDYEYRDREYTQSDASQYGDMAMRDRRYDGHYYYPFEVAGRFGKEHYPMYPDYSSGSPYLSEKELREWAMRLLQSIDEKYKDTLQKERIVREAEEVGIHFDKFTKDEFYVTVLMMYTDYSKTLGTANLDVYLKLAKDWICDEDVAIKYGEKLAVYHDMIVKGM